MDAELESLRGHNYAAASRYEMAELYAGSCNLTQDRALAFERYGEHLARLGPDHETEAKTQLSEAVRLYKEWGAHAKVAQLYRLHANILGPALLSSSMSMSPEVDVQIDGALPFGG